MGPPKEEGDGWGTESRTTHTTRPFRGPTEGVGEEPSVDRVRDSDREKRKRKEWK